MRGWRSLGRDSKDAIMWYSSNTELLPACSEPSGARSCNCLDLGQDVQHCTLELYLHSKYIRTLFTHLLLDIYDDDALLIDGVLDLYHVLMKGLNGSVH